MCGGKSAGVYKNVGMAVTCMRNRCDVMNIMTSELSDAEERQWKRGWEGGVGWGCERERGGGDRETERERDRDRERERGERERGRERESGRERGRERERD